MFACGFCSCRDTEKVQKLAEGLQKSPQLKLKELSKFLDTIAANIDDCFDLDLFGALARSCVCVRELATASAA